MSVKPSIWKNRATTAKIGRDPAYKHIDEPHMRGQDWIPHIAPGGKTFFLDAGGEFTDIHGVCRMMIENTYRYLVECHDIKEIAALGVPPDRIKWHTEPNEKGEEVPNKSLPPIGFFGVHYVLQDVTTAHKAILDLSGNRKETMERVIRLESGVRKKDELLEQKERELAMTSAENGQLKAELETLKRKLTEKPGRRAESQG